MYSEIDMPCGHHLAHHVAEYALDGSEDSVVCTYCNNRTTVKQAQLWANLQLVIKLNNIGNKEELDARDSTSRT